LAGQRKDMYDRTETRTYVTDGNTHRQ